MLEAVELNVQDRNVRSFVAQNPLTVLTTVV